jgi:2-dehydropantoate 2-reductase
MIKNPVRPAIEYYFQKMKNQKEFPILVLSQNGISAKKEAIEGLKKVLKERAKKVQIVRMVIFNPIEKEEIEGKFFINYSLPLRVAFGIVSPKKELPEIKGIFEKAGIEAEKIPPEKIEEMEFSKLFLNLIGMASVANNLSISQGFEDKKIFREEILALKEYIKIARKKGIEFLNFRHYPVKLFAFLIHFLPVAILSLFRKKIGKLIEKGREGKLKGNLDEIDYYNGEVIKLGKKYGILTPINKKIYKKIKFSQWRLKT